MNDIGRPGYDTDRLRRQVPVGAARQRAPFGAGGLLRVRAILAAMAATYAWCWLTGALHQPLWLSLVAAGLAVRWGRRSRDVGASDLSLTMAAAAWVAGAVYLVYGLWDPAYALIVQHAGWAKLIGYLISS